MALISPSLPHGMPISLSAGCAKPRLHFPTPQVLRARTNQNRRLRNGSTALLSVAHTTRPGTYIETTYTGQGDPGYWHTCHLIAESALALVLPPPEGTCLPPLGQRGGCLTPSTGLGMVLVRRLRESGKVAMESRVIVVDDDDDEGKKRR